MTAGNAGELAFLPLHVLALELQARRLSSVVLVEHSLERIARFDAKLHSFVALYAEEAHLAAEAADVAISSGRAVGPWHGIPFALKDIIDVEGRITTGGSKVWQDRRSAVTATVANKLFAAGMILVGKTHTVEFAIGGWGTNQHMGTPWNPWDTDVRRTPGGSSSGSGVAVAAGLVPCALGTDTGGSIRLPASWCGIVGLKPTVGRISIHGILPTSSTLDSPGPMTRSVEDAAILFDLLQGPDPLDATTSRQSPSNVLETLKGGVAGLRLASMPPTDRIGVQDAVLAAYDASLERLRRLGAAVVDIALPYPFAEFATRASNITRPESYSYLADIVDRMDLPIDEAVRPRILAGRNVSASDYLHALRERERIKAEFARPLAEVDAVLTPTTATPAIPIVDVDQSTSPSVFTRIVNYLDLCALSVPNGFTASGLPTSLQIICKGGEEATALRIGWALEQATSWHERLPPGF